MAGVRLPLQSHPLQALVSEPVKPVLDCVVMSNTVHVYVSQSDKGELVMGAGIDAFNSYAQRGSFPIIEAQIAATLELFPIFSRLKMLRSWAGIVDVSPDASPIIGKLPVAGLYLNGGWGTGGFKATPGAAHLFAWTIAHDEPHPINAPFTIERFRDGHLIDRIPSRHDLKSDILRTKIQAVERGLSRLRAKYDEMTRSRVLRHCRCNNPNCPTYFFDPPDAARELERLRRDVLTAFRDAYPAFKPPSW